LALVFRKEVKNGVKLCFGTFANVLLLCGADGIEKKKLLNILVQSVDRSCKLTSNAVTGLLQCTANLPESRSNGLGDVKSCAESADPRKVAAYFYEKIIKLSLIDPNKRKLAVLAILDIMDKDESIVGDTVVELVSGAKKDALLMQSRFALSHFLAGVFLHTARVDNRPGKAVADKIDWDFVVSFAPLQDTISFVIPNGEEEAIETMSAAFVGYMNSAKQKYETMKTLLYSNEPRPFYSFYVPNRAVHSVGRSRTTIENVTLESLTEISNFIIFEGVGGLGKSMMMRHLLLNTIENFSKLRRVPIFLPLKDYNEAAGSLEDFIFAKAEALNSAVTRDDFDATLDNGLFLLLFDGLDEINGERSGGFEREIETFTDKHPKNCFVISSRPFQTFVSFTRFTVLKLQPFTQQQALRLIDRLEFRPDEPEFKNKFRALVEGSLYKTHKSFIENPLLLTIMLLTFEKFADIPTKMHIFYRKAFITLSETHDASKSGYKRIYKSGLMIDDFSNYFAEFCFHSYKDSKFDFSEEEFARYFDILRISDNTVKAADFAHDLCANLCLMYFEGGRFHFTHRSFQEYFCALFFSKQKDIFIKRLGGFFEDRRRRMHGDQVFNMLYDMIPDKVETNIFIPFLQEIFDSCDNGDGYWTFLERFYPRIFYNKGDVNEYPSNSPDSFLFGFLIRQIKPRCEIYCDDLPENEEFVCDEFGYIWSDDQSRELINIGDIEKEYPWIEELPETEGWTYMFEVSAIRGGRYYDDILEMLDDDDFDFKSEYNALRKYFDDIKAKQQSDDDFFAGLL